jgi:L-asparaginase II
MNCSGKHAAFLLACVTQGWPIDTYLEPRHPLQLAIRRTVEDYTGELVEHTGTDGCGAPVHAVTLRGLALAIGLVAGARPEIDPSAARLAAAIRADPWALDTPVVAALMSDLDLIAKNGAEGVFVAATPDGTAVAVKMLDGSTRASITVALSLLAEAGAIDRALAHDVALRSTDPVLGGGEVVGELRSVV